MSLKVWLPLDGDLRNLGASNAIVTNSSATINTTGKIGSCYSFAKNAYLDINKETMQNFSNAVSICFWIKINSWNTNWDTFFQAGKGSTAWAQYHIGILRNSANYLCWTLGNGSTASNANYRTGNITLGEWTHVTCTYGEGKWATYLNGILSNSGTTTIVPNFSNITSIKIGGLAGAYKCDCLLNDFRVYDHCLSAAEVHEIAMGLVLHYKLDSMKVKTGTNLVTGVTKGGHTTVLTDGRIGVQTTGENKDTYFTINLSESIINGTKYFLSCDASGVSEGAYWGFPLGTQSNSALPFKIYNGHNEYSFTANDISWGSNRLFMDDANRADWANKATFWNFELYKAPALEVEDSSGYGHNGETINEITISSDTPRYNSSVQLNGSNAAIKVSDNKWMVQGAEAITINLWAKSTAWAGAKLFSCTESGGFNTEAGSSGYLRFPIHVYTNAEKTSTAYKYDSKEIKISELSTTDWNMLTFIYNSTGTRTYINGELHHTYTNTSYGIHFNTNARLFLGCEASGASPSSPYFNGQISDFRVYCTPLLDKDIKLLYNTSMRVDNSQGIHSFEFDEIQENLFRSELISPYAKSNFTTRIGEIVYHNDAYAMNIAPAPFYKNLQDNLNGFLLDCFEANTSYTLDMWIDVDSVIHNGNNVSGGLQIVYSDGTSDNTFVLVGGNKGYQHKKLITPANKTIKRISVYYSVSTDVFYRLDSYICKTDTNNISKTGITTGSNFIQSSKASIAKGGEYYATHFIEI